MNTDGNTAAIERMMAEREAYDDQRETTLEVMQLRDEVDALVAKLATARRDALEEAAKVAVDYGKVQFSANIENHPQYASDAADDALEIANAIRALTTEGKDND